MPHHAKASSHPGGTFRVRVADAADAAHVAEFAARTFPLASPTGTAADDISAFIAEKLTPARFAEYLGAPDHRVFVAVASDSGDERIIGYAMVIHGSPAYDEVAAELGSSNATELSKLYVDPAAQGGAVSRALFAAARAEAHAIGSDVLWLGVNDENSRARAFYRRQGLRPIGRRNFTVGTRVFHDYLYGASLTQ